MKPPSISSRGSIGSRSIGVSPLSNLTKEEVREFIQVKNIWNKGSDGEVCISRRIILGVDHGGFIQIESILQDDMNLEKSSFLP